MCDTTIGGRFEIVKDASDTASRTAKITAETLPGMKDAEGGVRGAESGETEAGGAGGGGGEEGEMVVTRCPDG